MSFADDVQPIFDTSCVGCHGDGGTGGQWGPDLTDDVWVQSDGTLETGTSNSKDCAGLSSGNAWLSLRTAVTDSSGYELLRLWRDSAGDRRIVWFGRDVAQAMASSGGSPKPS